MRRVLATALGFAWHNALYRDQGAALRRQVPATALQAPVHTTLVGTMLSIVEAPLYGCINAVKHASMGSMYQAACCTGQEGMGARCPYSASS